MNSFLFSPKHILISKSTADNNKNKRILMFQHAINVYILFLRIYWGRAPNSLINKLFIVR